MFPWRSDGSSELLSVNDIFMSIVRTNLSFSSPQLPQPPLFTLDWELRVNKGAKSVNMRPKHKKKMMSDFDL